MDRRFLFDILLLLLVLLILGNAVPIAITGFNFSNLHLYIESDISGEITEIDYDPFVTLSPFELQNITVLFTNTGTQNYTSRTELFVYYYDDGYLDQTNYFYDSSLILPPGMKRSFLTTFRPEREGYYYVRARVSYDTKIAESWVSFYSGYVTYNETPGPIITGGGGGGGGGWTPPLIYDIAAPNLAIDIEYPEEIDLYPGQSILVGIKAKNVGSNATMHEVRFHFSASSLLDIDVNPKHMYYFAPNQTITFLMDIKTRGDTPTLTYPINFEIVTRELKESRTISLNVRNYNVSLREEVFKRIINYEYLINELDREILEASVRGVNVTFADKHLDFAKINLQAAKNFYELVSYENARDKLYEVKQNLKDAAFALAHASFAIFEAPAFSPFWILLIIILIPLIFLYILRRRKKKEMKKPKLLKATEAET